MRLGTKLTCSLSLIIVVVLSGYGYFQTLSRRDMLVRKMKIEVKSIGRMLKISLEKISLPREMEYVQDLIDAVDEYEGALGVMVYHGGRELLFRSSSMRDETEPYLEKIRRVIQDDSPREEFGVYQTSPVFSYTFPLKDRKGKNIGGVSILQRTSLLEEDIRKAKWNILAMILLLIGGMVGLILFVTRRWISQPVSKLMEGIGELGRGDLRSQIDLKGEDELSQLAQAFNQMGVKLSEAQRRSVEEARARLELERSLRQSEKLATIGQLASGLAHEIGTPLNIIGGRAELIKRRLDDRGWSERNLDIITQQADRITKIIRQLLGFVRKEKPERAALDIQTVLRTTLDFLDHQIQEKGIEVVEEWKDPLFPVAGDPGELQQVFLNLIVNAIQAMPGGGTLRISGSSKRLSKEGVEGTEREYAEVCVQDTGLGMERENLSSIFDPFFTTKSKGTGLGLMVSQGIVQDHEGWIHVESEIKRGSVFKVYLPCSRMEAGHEE